MAALVQPQFDPSTMAAARLATAIDSSAAPARSALCAIGILDLPQHPYPDHQGDQAEGQVHQEDPAPAGLDQDPADRRAEGGGRPADGRPQPDGGALAGRAEGGEQEPERGGQHQGAPTGLEDAGGHEELERGGDGTEGGGGGEDAQPEQERPLAPGPVGPAPGRHQQRGEDDGVGAQHPRHGAQRLAVEALRDAREGDVDDEQVQRREEHPREHHRARSGSGATRVALGGAPASGS